MREIHDLSFDIDRFLEDAARAKQQLDVERWREELRPRALRLFPSFARDARTALEQEGVRADRLGEEANKSSKRSGLRSELTQVESRQHVVPAPSQRPASIGEPEGRIGVRSASKSSAPPRGMVPRARRQLLLRQIS